MFCCCGRHTNSMIFVKMNHKISHLKGLQRTTSDNFGALSTTYGTVRSLYVPPTTFYTCGCGMKMISLLWQAHKHYDFWSELNNNLSHLKGLQRTTADQSGTLSIT